MHLITTCPSPHYAVQKKVVEGNLKIRLNLIIMYLGDMVRRIDVILLKRYKRV